MCASHEAASLYFLTISIIIHAALCRAKCNPRTSRKWESIQNSQSSATYSIVLQFANYSLQAILNLCKTKFVNPAPRGWRRNYSLKPFSYQVINKFSKKKREKWSASDKKYKSSFRLSRAVSACARPRYEAALPYFSTRRPINHTVNTVRNAAHVPQTNLHEKRDDPGNLEEEYQRRGRPEIVGERTV